MTNNEIEDLETAIRLMMECACGESVDAFDMREAATALQFIVNANQPKHEFDDMIIKFADYYPKGSFDNPKGAA